VRGHPAPGGFAQHDGLRIKPAALVEQATQLSTVVAAFLNGVFVVDADDQPLVGDAQQGQAGGLVNVGNLGFDDAIFDLVAHAQTVAATNAVDLQKNLPKKVVILLLFSWSQ
jgi:hypothetical protein